MRDGEREREKKKSPETGKRDEEEGKKRRRYSSDIIFVEWRVVEWWEKRGFGGGRGWGRGEGAPCYEFRFDKNKMNGIGGRRAALKISISGCWREWCSSFRRRRIPWNKPRSGTLAARNRWRTQGDHPASSKLGAFS